jgi:hypothetical protein
VVLAGVGVLGLVAAVLLPRGQEAVPPTAPPPEGSVPTHGPGTTDEPAAPPLPAPRPGALGQPPVPVATDTRSGSMNGDPRSGRRPPGDGSR